jgi:hypothetical protein
MNALCFGNVPEADMGGPVLLYIQPGTFGAYLKEMLAAED